MNFFDECTHDYFQNIHPEKCLKQAKSFKEFFKNAFKMILRKNMHSGKVSNKHQEKVSIFGHHRKQKNLGNHPKQVFLRINSKSKTHYQGKKERFYLTRDNPLFSVNGEWKKLQQRLEENHILEQR